MVPRKKTNSFEPRTYGSTVEGLLRGAAPPPLDRGRPSADVRSQLEPLVPETLCPERSLADRQMAAACCAGLWLYHNFLDESHTISQSIDTPTGNFWHGVVHRREGDYSNSKYWFNRVGDHPVFAALSRAAKLLAFDSEPEPEGHFLSRQSAWDPFAWIDLCAAVVHGASAEESLCRKIQQREWELLFDYCFRRAFAA